MSTPGRSEIPAVLKRWADTRGEAGNEIVELLQPVVVVGDLTTELPFTVSFPWNAQFARTAGGAGVWNGFEILLQNPTSRSWIEIEWIQNLAASADFGIGIVAAGTNLTSPTPVTPQPRRLRGVVDLGGLGDMTMRTGVLGSAPSQARFRLTQGELYPMPFAIGGGEDQSTWAIFMCAAFTVNTAIDLQCGGRLHILTAR